MTIRVLSDFQLGQLRGYFIVSHIIKMGIVQETGDLVIEYQGIDHQPQSISIPRNDLLCAEAEFEIIQPKQLK